MAIVCGTDLSDRAAPAVRVAAALSKRLGESLKLVHAADAAHAAFLLGGEEGAGETPLRAALRRAAEAVRAEGIDVEELALVGHADEVLVDVARRSQARLLIVASGRSAEAQGRLGRVVERTVQTSPVPVLVVRDPAPWVSWARGARRLRVMVGVNWSAVSKGALRWLAELRRVGPCDVIVAHSTWPVDDYVRLDIPLPMPPAALHPEIEQSLVRDLREWIGGIAGQGTLSLLVRPAPGRVDNHITALAAEEHVDLLVVGTHQRAGLARLWYGSVSQGVLQQAQMSVACVPLSEPLVEASVPCLRRVLVPTDFSALANRAIPFAYAVVEDGGVVHVVHAVVEPQAPKSAWTRKLQALVPATAEARGIETRVEVLSVRDVALGICHAAERHGVDAVCMATHGRLGLAGWVVGSVSREVLSRWRRPVLFVPTQRHE